jgi:hypothetical protein
MEHHHGMWTERDYTIFTGDTRINALADQQIGKVLKINPISLMYAVKAEVLITHDFAATPPETFTVTLSECAGLTRLVSNTASTYEVLTWDVSDYARTILKEICTVGLSTFFKVSNNIVPITVYGVTLRFLMFQTDTFGGYENPVDQLLMLDTKTSKEYLLKRKKESLDFRYLSGLPIG